MSHFIHKSLFVAVLGCAASLFSFPGSASAQVVCETFTENYCLTNPTGPNPFVFPIFNTNLGTLDCVDLRFKFELNPVVSVYNSTTATVGFTNASIDVPIDISGPGNFDFSTILDATVKSGNAAPGVTNFVLAPHPGSGSEEIPTNDLSFWEGKPNAKIDFEMTPGFPTFQGTAKGSGLFFGGSSTEWGSITVQYCYTPKSTATPEPPGPYLTAIVGLAMLVVVLGRRRMSKV